MPICRQFAALTEKNLFNMRKDIYAQLRMVLNCAVHMGYIGKTFSSVSGIL